MRQILLSLILAVLSSLPQSGLAQGWEKLHEVDGDVSYLGFNRFSVDTSVGYCGVWRQDGMPCQLLRTTDGGLNWELVMGSLPDPPVDMAFKDALVGWMITGLTRQGCLFKTIDGGKTWTPTTLRLPGSGLHYSQSSERLFANLWPDFPADLTKRNIHSMVSTDDGETWHPYAHYRLNGLSFSDALHGIASTLHLTQYVRTADGGLTWDTLDWEHEAWEPLAIEETPICFILSETTRQIFRSNNRGETWNLVSEFPNPIAEAGGQIIGNLCGLLIQGHGLNGSEEGVWFSGDEGLTWRNIGGPPGNGDTRPLDLVGHKLFAGENRDQRRGGARGIWRYEFPSGTFGTSTTINLTYEDDKTHKLLTPGVASPAKVVLSPSGLSEINTLLLTLDFDRACIRLSNVEPGPGWQMIDQSASTNSIAVRVGRDQGMAGTVALMFDVEAAMVLSTDRSIALRSVEHEGPISSSACHRLGLKNEVISYDLDLSSCGDSLLLRLLDAETPFEIISAIMDDNGVTVEFYSRTEEDCRVGIVNSLGTLVEELNHKLRIGVQRVFLPLHGSAVGTYLIHIRSASHSLVKKIQFVN